MICIGQKHFQKALELLHNVCDLVRICLSTLTIYSCCNSFTLVLVLIASLSSQVVTAPMSSINAIAVEAFKKYILVSLIQNRQVCFSLLTFII
jgi:COP9 signalosome complex subunit 3